MASQTAVVASDAGAYAEMIVDGTGTSVAAGDGEALRKAIEPYLADPALAERDGENALRHVRATFPLEEAAAISGVYERVFAGNNLEPVPEVVLWLQMALFCVPVLMYVQYIAVRYSKITIFAHTCRSLFQALRESSAVRP